MGKLEVDASSEAFLNEDDPDLAYYNITRPLWGYDEYAIVCATRDDWLSEDGVAAAKALVDDLSRVNHVESVLSILGVPLFRQKPGKKPGPKPKATVAPVSGYNEF